MTLIFLRNIIVFFKPLIEKKLFNYDKKNHAWADETSVDALKISFEFYLKHSLADDYLSATERDLYTSLALSVRDRLIKKGCSANIPITKTMLKEFTTFPNQTDLIWRLVRNHFRICKRTIDKEQKLFVFENCL